MFTVFFPGGVAREVSCEHDDKLTCTTDMLSFKGYIHRWLAVVAQLAPFTRQRIFDTLRISAAAAVEQCTGGESGRVCGFRWNQAYDGTNGAGQEMNVLGALLALLMDSVQPPFTKLNGGTSKGDPNAGADASYLPSHKPITAADKAGAGILTALVLSSIVLTFFWMGSSLYEGGSRWE
jgi:mannan endo-1,6-alpha-mannosidase